MQVKRDYQGIYSYDLQRASADNACQPSNIRAICVD